MQQGRSIPEKMKAVVCYGPEDYRLEEVPVPKAGPQEVVIRVEACGICAGDIKAYDGAAMFWGGGVNPPYVKAPVIPGHEFIGEVVELGPGAREKYGLEIGDRAISEQIMPCWQCRYCLSGKYWMCEVHNIYGFQRIVADGAMAEYMKFPKGAINHKVPKDMPLKDAVMIEPLACAIHAVQRANIELQDVVVIAGLGPLGQCMAQVTRLKNPAKLIVLDIREGRLKLAERLSGGLGINVQEEDAIKLVKEMTGGYGCDKYIEATGHPSGVIQGLQMIRKLGTFVEFSVFGSDTTVDWSVIGDRKELDIHGAHLSPYTYPLAINFISSGKVKVSELVTHIFPLQEYQKAFETCHRGEAIKVILIPNN